MGRRAGPKWPHLSLAQQMGHPKILRRKPGPPADLHVGEEKV